MATPTHPSKPLSPLNPSLALAHPDPSPTPPSTLTNLTLHLPSHPSLLLSPSLPLPTSSSISDLKHRLTPLIQGSPHAGGIRLFAHGKALGHHELLSDIWPEGEGHVHIAVHPSAWGGRPPAPPAGGASLPAESAAPAQVQVQTVQQPAPISALHRGMGRGTIHAPFGLAPPTPLTPTPTHAVSPAVSPFTPFPAQPFGQLNLPARFLGQASPHLAALGYYTHLRSLALSQLLNTAPPASPYRTTEEEQQARSSARIFVEGMGVRSGLEGEEGCDLPGVGEGDALGLDVRGRGGGEWKVVVIDNLPYLLQTNSSSTPASETQQLALRTLLSTQPILQLLTSPSLLPPSPLPFPPFPGAAFPPFPGAAFPPPPVPAHPNPPHPRQLLALHLRLPPPQLLLSLLFSLLRILFFTFLFTRGASLERKTVVVLAAGVWGMWEVQRILGGFWAAGLGVGGAGAGARAGGPGAPAAGGPNLGPGPAGAGGAPAAGGAAQNAPGAGRPGQAARTPVLELLANILLPYEDTLLFPPSSGLVRPAPAPPTQVERALSHPLLSYPLLWTLSILPEFSRLRAKLLLQREKKVREVYGGMVGYWRRRKEAREAAAAGAGAGAGGGDEARADAASLARDMHTAPGQEQDPTHPVQPTEEERTAIDAFLRMRRREQDYVLRVLGGEMDDLAVVWQAAEVQGEEVAGGW